MNHACLPQNVTTGPATHADATLMSTIVFSSVHWKVFLLIIKTLLLAFWIVQGHVCLSRGTGGANH